MINDNYINLIHRIESIDTRLSKIEREYIANPEKAFFDGEYLDARIFIKELISKAATSVAIINPYADAKALGFFQAKEKTHRFCR